MRELLVIGLLLLAAALVVGLVRRLRLRRLARDRLGEALASVAVPAPPLSPVTAARPFASRLRWLPWVLAVPSGLACYFLFGLGGTFSLTVAAVVGLLGGQIEALWHDRRTQQIEAQLTDAIDLMVGALRAGGGVTAALENAARESRQPLRGQLEEVVGRIRLGDDPRTVFRQLSNRVPLETFLLFTSALAVHWEVGGSLAPTLATVGRTIRDRIELSRRVRSMTAQARISTIAIIGVTYFIALVMWRNDPERMEAFLGTSLGATIVAGTVLLQGLGIVWGSYISRAEV
jgi:tight adherence protein B